MTNDQIHTIIVISLGITVASTWIYGIYKIANSNFNKLFKIIILFTILLVPPLGFIPFLFKLFTHDLKTLPKRIEIINKIIK